MYISCLSSLTQSCEMSIFLHEAKPSNQFSLKEKHVNHDLVLKFNRTKKGYFCLKDVDNSNSNVASLYSDILQKFSFSFYSRKIKKMRFLFLFSDHKICFFISLSPLETGDFFFIFPFLISKLEKRF